MARLIIEGFGSVDQVMAFGDWLGKQHPKLSMPDLSGTVMIIPPRWDSVSYDGDVVTGVAIVRD